MRERYNQYHANRVISTAKWRRVVKKNRLYVGGATEASFYLCRMSLFDRVSRKR